MGEGRKIIDAKEDSPEIIMDFDNRLLKITGSSYPEDAVKVYRDVINWLMENASKFDSLTCEFDYKILSSASNRQVYEILVILDNMYKKGKDVRVKWFYNDYDEDMYSEGVSYKDSFDLPIELIEK